MRKLRLLLPLLAVLLLAPTFKATSAQAGKLQQLEQPVLTEEYYLGTIDIIVDDVIILPVKLYAEDDWLGFTHITRAENAINHTAYTANGTESGGIVDVYVDLPSGTTYYNGTFY